MASKKEKEEAIEAEYTDKKEETGESSSPPALVAPRYLKPLTFDNESKPQISFKNAVALVLALVIVAAIIGLYIYGSQIAGGSTSSALINSNFYT